MKRLLIYLLSLFTIAINAQDTILIPTQSIGIKNSCHKIIENSLITSEDEYKSIVAINKSSTPLNCDSNSFPQIDFKKNNLIWIDFIGGSKPIVKTYLYKIPSQKKYLFLIRAIYDSNLEGTFLNIHEQAKKFEADYIFEYKIECKYLFVVDK